MVAFPPPPITLRQRSSTFIEPLCSLRRVLASGCHSFLFEWLEKVSQPSLAEPFGSDQGVIRINSRLSLLSLGRHRTDCRSLCSVSKAATFVTGCLYSWSIFRSTFCVFYFLTSLRLKFLQSICDLLLRVFHFFFVFVFRSRPEKTFQTVFLFARYDVNV